MDLLLDTHAFLWFVWNDPQLSLSGNEGSPSPVTPPGDQGEV